MHGGVPLCKDGVYFASLYLCEFDTGKQAQSYGERLAIRGPSSSLSAESSPLMAEEPKIITRHTRQMRNNFTWMLYSPYLSSVNSTLPV